MKTINLPPASDDVARLLDEARQNDIVVKLADGSEFMLIAIDEFDDEVAKSRSNPRLMALLKARASQTDTMPLDEVKRRLDLSIVCGRHLTPLALSITHIFVERPLLARGAGAQRRCG